PSRSVATMRSVREANNGYNTKIQLSLFVPAPERGSWRRLQRGVRMEPYNDLKQDHSRPLPDVGRRKTRSSNGHVHHIRIVNRSSPGAP
ncbi:MAG TPA: hypothetical protein VIK32_04325, partial [Candidatus Limnocylindrales bacterium]